MSAKTEKNTSSAYERLEKQNEKLRNELKELNSTLERILSKFNPTKSTQQVLDSENKDAAQKIKYFKSEITKMKKELQGNPNIPKITDLENELKFLNTQAKSLEKEKSTLLKYEKIHQNALDSAFNSNTYPEKIKNLRNELRVNKEKLKELVSKEKKEEKTLAGQHERCVDLENKIRKLFELIKAKKKEGEAEEKSKKIEGNELEVNEFLVKDLQEQIARAESEKAEKEGKLKKRIKELETQIREKKHHLEMLKIKVREKEQESRISLMRITEAKKLVKHNQLRPIRQRSGNTTPGKIALSPITKSTENLGVAEGTEGTERRRSSTNQKLFHQETMNIIKKLHMHINFT